MRARELVPPWDVAAGEEKGLALDLAERTAPGLFRSFAHKPEWRLPEPDEITARHDALGSIAESLLFLMLVHGCLVHDYPLGFHARAFFIAVQDVTHHREGLSLVKIRLVVGAALFVVDMRALQAEGLVIGGKSLRHARIDKMAAALLQVMEGDADEANAFRKFGRAPG